MPRSPSRSRSPAKSRSNSPSKKKSGKKKKKKLSKAARKALKEAKKERKLRREAQAALNVLSEKELRDAAAAGDVRRVEEALAKFGQQDDPPGDVDNPDGFGMTALLSAGMRGHTKIVEILIRGNQGTELVEKYDPETGDLMIDEQTGDPMMHQVPTVWANADVNAQSKDGGSTCLMWACERGHIDIVRLCLQAGCVPDTRNDYGWTALMLAALNGQIDCVEELFAHEGPVREVSMETIDFQHLQSGNTALLWAVSKGQCETVQRLLEIGANCRVKNISGQSAKDLADLHGHPDVLKILEDWDIHLESERAKWLEEIEMFGQDYVAGQGVDIQSLKECWRECPEEKLVESLDPDTGEPIFEEKVDEDGNVQLVAVTHTVGGCTCQKLPLSEEELEAIRIAEEEADAKREAKRKAREEKAAREARQKRRGRKGGGSKKADGKKISARSKSPSRSRRNRK